MCQTSEYVSEYETDTGSLADTASQTSGALEMGDGDFVDNLDEQPSKRRFSGEPPKSLRHVLDDELRRYAIWPYNYFLLLRVHNMTARHQMVTMDAYDRHKKLVNDYIQYYGGKWQDFKRDWSERLAKRYWDKLFKEYCIMDLSRYRENKFGMRWRVEKEVISGKGQFACGNVACPLVSTPDHTEPVRLRSWEVNFSYKERGERRNALVKVRLCSVCSDKLNYRRRHREVAGQQQSTVKKPGQPSPATSNPKDSVDTSSEVPDKPADATVWQSSSCSTTATAPKTQEEEFDAYFADLLM